MYLKSPLELLRLSYQPKKPSILADLHKVQFTHLEKIPCHPDIANLFPIFAQKPPIKASFGKNTTASPLKVGLVFSGGPAPGGHNIASGLFDALKTIHKDSRLFGFLKGPSGIIKGNYKELFQQEIDAYRNLGGFDLLGSGRTKIETTEQMQEAMAVCQHLSLDGLVIVGGDDSNTNAALLADFFYKHQSPTKVVGVPKTIDADLKNEHVAISFGFDTACRVYAELIGNIAKDAASSQKYTHFIKLMGRSASHIALECALVTRANYTLIGEEIQKEGKTLSQIILDLADLIVEREKVGKSHSVIIVPEGIVQFIPEIHVLIEELNHLLSKGEPSSAFEIIAGLSSHSRLCFEQFPESIQKQLLLRRDPHGNVQLSLIETEKLLADLVGKELEKRREAGLFSGSFHPLTHFFGYEGRAGFPSNFDADYCYALGQTTALLIRDGISGYMAFISKLNQKVTNWEVGAIPITLLMHLEKRKNAMKPVIEKALVNLEGKAFKYFAKHRHSWALEDHYAAPGPIQFYPDAEINPIPYSLTMDLS